MSGTDELQAHGIAMQQRRRWYDQEEACHRMLCDIREMPYRDIKEFCGLVITRFCERVQQDINRRVKKDLHLKSLGEASIGSLYKYGRQKRRWYDDNPVLHKAVASLYMLPPQALTVVGFKLGDTLGLIKLYSRVCLEIDQPPNTQNLVKICSTSLQTGPDEAREILIQAVGQEAFDSVWERYQGK